MTAYIKAVEVFLPEKIESNNDLQDYNHTWDIDKIFKKTGILTRHIANKNETALDLGVKASEKLFSENHISKDKIDYLIFCTQSPDYFLPTSACIIQDKLGLNQEIGAIDVNQGCSGFVYCLSIAKGLIESNQAKNILIITADTYSKFINKSDKSVRTLFGDAGTCTLISDDISGKRNISKIVNGTDGSGAKNLIVPHGGLRNPINKTSNVEINDKSNNVRSPSNLYMNGQSIYSFTLKKIPNVFNEILENSKYDKSKIDMFIFHQANKFILDSLQNKLDIPPEKMHRSYKYIGNTVSSTIPIGIHFEMKRNNQHKNTTALLLGFGVGLSWAGTIVNY
tara:strand:+ start:2124 stop:3137 length:1014 start_codon:yes stop_codon:yes gene_type:complete